MCVVIVFAVGTESDCWWWLALAHATLFNIAPDAHRNSIGGKRNFSDNLPSHSFHRKWIANDNNWFSSRVLRHIYFIWNSKFVELHSHLVSARWCALCHVDNNRIDKTIQFHMKYTHVLSLNFDSLFRSKMVIFLNRAPTDSARWVSDDSCMCDTIMRSMWETIATMLNDIVPNKASQITQKPHKGIDHYSLSAFELMFGPWSVWRMTPSLRDAIISSFVLANKLNKNGDIEPMRRRKLSDRRHFVACMFTVLFNFHLLLFFLHSCKCSLLVTLMLSCERDYENKRMGSNEEKEERFEVSTGVRANTRSYNNQVSISNSRTCLLHLEP